MYDRIFKAPAHQSFLLLGPRGTGKSSWLTNQFKNAPYFDLLDESTLFDLQRNSGLIYERLPENYKGPVIIDEVQKLPKLLDEVHRLIEKKKGLQFILSGSSARKLKRDGVNLLAGRAAYERFHPLTVDELGSDFNLKKAITHGLLPTVWNESNPTNYLKAYVLTYVDQEVKLEGLSRNITEFNRFLQAASFSQGQPLNVSRVASDCGVERRSVSNYFEILEDILIATRLPVFSRRAKRKLITHDKFYFFDCGVFQTLRPRGPLDSDNEINGAAIETLLLQNLMAYNDLKKWNYQIFYWHSRQHTEVDFILYGSRGLFAIEIKSSSYLRDQDFDGLQEFKSDYPEAQCLMLYTGTKEYLHKKIRVASLNTFLKKMGDEF